MEKVALIDISVSVSSVLLQVWVERGRSYSEVLAGLDFVCVYLSLCLCINLSVFCFLHARLCMYFYMSRFCFYSVILSVKCQL